MNKKIKSIKITYTDGKKETIKNPKGIALEKWKVTVKYQSEDGDIFVLKNVKKISIRFSKQKRKIKTIGAKP